MHKNHVYNLMNQLVQEEKSLWRIKSDYLKDAKGIKDCTDFWKKMAKDKEDHIVELTSLIKKHLQ
ncbi:MAG: hypothetical protein ABIO72_00670 [Patescibacteria group bacterium]